MKTVTDFIFLGSKISADGDLSHEIKRHLLLGRKAMTNLDSLLKRRDITLPTKVSLVKAMVSPVVMNGCEELDQKEAWALKNWCFQIMVQVKSQSNKSILKEINPELIGRAEAEAPTLWSPNVKSQLIGKDPDAGKDWRQKAKRVAEDEIVR